MSWSYDLTTSVGQVRLLCMDIDREKPDFSDEELAFFAATEATLGVKGAASLALLTLAADQSRIAVRRERLGLTDDLTQVARNLREQASAMRAQAVEESATGVGMVIVSPSWTARDYQRNVLLDNVTLTDYAQTKDSTL